MPHSYRSAGERGGDIAAERAGPGPGTYIVMGVRSAENGPGRGGRRGSGESNGQVDWEVAHNAGGSMGEHAGRREAGEERVRARETARLEGDPEEIPLQLVRARRDAGVCLLDDPRGSLGERTGAPCAARSSVDARTRSRWRRLSLGCAVRSEVRVVECYAPVPCGTWGSHRSDLSKNIAPTVLRSAFLLLLISTVRLESCGKRTPPVIASSR
ncbi:hypothetical protein PYCCODRAFT_164785 [Trametes coccinea BRFM310]|uniref:Uncharacterized protein n=1 Tax=Trametes coccinea (strain BRFM310) TaxID=1353009 RepID=A0A1Y2ITK4_TRAC3|nr:hypothetical protein PYCCODRAFT_164785 [Trametes coccinea BRFM310]